MLKGIDPIGLKTPLGFWDPLGAGGERDFSQVQGSRSQGLCPASGRMDVSAQSGPSPFQGVEVGEQPTRSMAVIKCEDGGR